jgi:hypothetical protein
MCVYCRERQKATISSLEAEVNQKLAELQLLSEENEMLKLRSAVLEAVTSGREYHVSVVSYQSHCVVLCFVTASYGKLRNQILCHVMTDLCWRPSPVAGSTT